jgi:hypothetical protein
MAFASTVNSITVFGNKRIAFGEFTQVSLDVGGAIATGLSALAYFEASYSTSNVDADGTVTIVTADPGAAQTGYWMAIGE